MPFILPLTVALADMEVWLVRMFQLVFLNLPETREERLRREILREAEKRHREAMAEAKEAAVAESMAQSAAWYARMKAAQDKGEPFDEPPPWEQ